MVQRHVHCQTWKVVLRYLIRFWIWALMPSTPLEGEEGKC